MPDTSLSRDELKTRIESGVASDDEIAAYLGPDLTNELNAQFSDPYDLERQIDDWYNAVMKPLGISRDATANLYTGRTTIAEFDDALTDEQRRTFEANFESLQAAYQAKLDHGELS